jgi:hypothetical protein
MPRGGRVSCVSDFLAPIFLLRLNRGINQVAEAICGKFATVADHIESEPHKWNPIWPSSKSRRRDTIKSLARVQSFERMRW